MAYLFSYSETSGTGAATVSGNMPPHQSGDILVAHAVMDSGTITLPTSGGGGGTWAALPSAPANPVSSGTVSYIAYLKASGSAETFPSVAWPDAFVLTIFCFRDVDQTTPFDGVTPIHTTNASANSATATATAANNTADALVVYLFSQEVPSTTPSAALTGPGVMWISGQDTGTTAANTQAHQCSAWHILRTANTAPPTPIAYSNLASTWVKATFCLRNKSGGVIPPYIDDYISPGSMIFGCHFNPTSTTHNVTSSTNGITATINGKTATPGTASGMTDSGINPFANAWSLAAAQTAATALVGPEGTLTTALDTSSGGLICGAVIAPSSKAALFGIGTVADGGGVFRIGSGGTATTAWNAYQITAKDAKRPPVDFSVFAIEAGYSGSAYASGSSNCSASAVKYFQILRNAPYFSSSLMLTELHYVSTQVIAGGSSTQPVDISGLVSCGKSFRLPVIQQAGSGGVLSFAKLQIGGGDSVNFQIDAGAIQFPTRASATTKDLQYHGSDNKLGIDFSGKSGDVIKLTNSVVTSGTPYYFSINSNATSAATWDFSGTLIVNATVTLRNVVTFNNMAFSGCPSITLNTVTLNNSKINKVPTTSASFVTSGTCSLTSCSIDVSQVTAGNHWWSGADPSIFHSCSFTGGGGHALNITATSGTVTLDGCKFTGFGADTSTGAAVYFTATTGSITLSISNSGDTPTVRTAGISVTISNPKTKTFTNIPSGAELRVRQGAYSLAYQANITSGSYAYNYQAQTGKTATVVVTKAGLIIDPIDFNLDTTSENIPIVYSPDPSYSA